jgi:hypothetical protein
MVVSIGTGQRIAGRISQNLMIGRRPGPRLGWLGLDACAGEKAGTRQCERRQ